MNGTVLFGIVTDNADPDNLGRVQVKLPDWAAEVVLPWLRVLSPFTGADIGAICVPEVEEQVVVLCGPGGVAGMVVIGQVYTPKRKPPALGGGAAGAPEVRGMLTKGGTEISVNDKSGSEKVTIQTKDAKVSVVFDGAAKKLLVLGDTEINLESATKVVVKAKNVEITGDSGVKIASASAKIALEGASVEIKGSGEVKISAPMISLG